MANPDNNTEISDLAKLVRAYRIIVGTCDTERAIVGPVSQAWIASEVEHNITLAEIPSSTLNTVRGKELLRECLFPEETLPNEYINPAAFDVANLGKNLWLNSNRLPKLEPSISGVVLASNILLGVQMYGNRGKGLPAVSHDLIVATIVHDCLGKRDKFSHLLQEHQTYVDEMQIERELGNNVLRLVREIRSYKMRFERSLDAPEETIRDIPVGVANAIAATYVGQLRLTARAAGDEIFSILSDAQRAELDARGIQTRGFFPERPWLDAHYLFAKAALDLPGVDYCALQEPLGNTLLMAVDDALVDARKRKRLVGRRGRALHEVHLNLPIMEYYNASETPNTLSTTHLASLEMMRHFDKGRRKSTETMLCHAFQIAATGEKLLGNALEPMISTLGILHDVAEDGCNTIAGYDQSLYKIRLRFGGPIAAMVAEVTDSSTLQDAFSKAQVTREYHTLLSAKLLYNVDRYTEMVVKPTDSTIPYTIAGIVTKLIDTATTQKEGLRDLAVMKGWWRHSGARIYWAENNRGAIIRPLVERLVEEVLESEQDPSYCERPNRPPKAWLQAFRPLVEYSINTADDYMAQNLAILAAEYSLEVEQRMQLIQAFTDPTLSAAQFKQQFVEEMLDERQLELNIRYGHVPQKYYASLFRKNEMGEIIKDCTTFLSYRKSALRRVAIRKALKLDSEEKVAERQRTLHSLLRHLDRHIPFGEHRVRT